RIEEGVRDVRLATRLPPTARAFRQVPVRVARERRHPRRIGLVVLDAGKDYRELVLRHGQSTARVAVEDGDGRPPVPLPRDAPVVEAIVDASRAEAAFFQLLGDRLLRLLP